MAKFLAQKPLQSVMLLLVCLQQLLIVVSAERQYHRPRQNQPHAANLIADSTDANNESNELITYKQQSRGYRSRVTSTRRGQFLDGNDDANYQFNNRELATSSRRKVRKQEQRMQKQSRGQMRSNEMQYDGHKCHIWVPVEVVDKYPYALRIQLDQRNQQQKIEICCPGYAPMRWPGSTICKPVCENCRNGRCMAPNECECYDSFVANDNGDCVFSCPLGCLNGRCFLDGTCQCDPGFKLDETRKFCRPICSNGCGMNPRHNCTEPEVCGCAKGYQLTDDGCIPVCDPDCGEGGECREPNECYCAPGYELKDGVCQRECYQKCDNGICYSNNRCICNPGYTYHERSTQCVPN